jgi:hypothetical protein
MIVEGAAQAGGAAAAGAIIDAAKDTHERNRQQSQAGRRLLRAPAHHTSRRELQVWLTWQAIE